MAAIETERKFLCLIPSEYPKNDHTKVITQTYLVRTDPAVQRRVRRIAENGTEKFFYTEKKYITDISREENEYEIMAERYAELLSEKDDELVPIEKTRHIFEYRRQNFEMDVYPFSDRFASIELELESEDQEIYFPPFIEILKEVTGNPAYSNANIAKAQKFPEE